MTLFRGQDDVNRTSGVDAQMVRSDNYNQMTWASIPDGVDHDQQLPQPRYVVDRAARC